MTGETNLIDVRMTEYEAQSFIEYQKNHLMFNILKDAGVFNVRNGKAILNFDAGGILTEVKCDVTTYKLGKPVVQFIQFS